jgi:recombinational DNA repair protein (RecF pathway)
MTTLEKLEELGFSIQDNICVFCSRTMDRWDRVCVSCKEYKGVMNIVDAVEYYGKDILSC